MKGIVFSSREFKLFVLVIGATITPCIAIAQYVDVSGKIIDAQTLRPLGNAEVYITNTTISTKTDTNGIYKLTKIPVGTYELITHYPGYETKQATFAATTIGQIINFSLVPRVIELPEVVIRDKSDWKLQFAKFKREFLGKADEANYEILNEHILNLKYNLQQQLLTANTNDFLEIINKRLGYKLRFLINNFWVDYKALDYHYSGSVIFEEMHGTAKQQKQWIKNRDNAYKGSFRHFMSALTSNQVKKSGFEIKKLIRAPNPQRPPDSLIMYKISKQFKYVPNNKPNNDSLNKWAELRRLPKIIETLEKDDVKETDIIKPGKLSHTFDLAFDDYLYVIYKHIVLSLPAFYVPAINELQRFSEAKSYQIAAISMNTPRQPITFNDKGIKISKGQLFNEGTWSESRVLDLLPFDYTPQK